MPDEQAGKMNLLSLTLFSVSAVLVIDTLTASASLGPSAITWWLITLVLFVVPYGLISIELGSAYPGEGGIYDWVKRAFGSRWAVRTTWFYWINVALWMPAVYILFAGMFAELFFPDLGIWWQILICIALTWLTVYICNISVDVGVWVVNAGAAAKIIVIAAVGIGGFIYAINHGVANAFTFESMTPSFDTALGFLPVIVFNLLGFELVATMGSEIKNAKRDVPISIFLSAAIVAGLYIFGTIGILAALPVDEIGLVAGLIDTMKTLFGGGAFGTFLTYTVGILALFTFISNMVTWTMGSSRAAQEAATTGELPAAVAKQDKVRRTPVGANTITGIVSTVVIVLYGLTSGTSDELFWTIFAFSSCIFLLPYLFMFPAHLKLRRDDPQTERPFKIGGGMLVQYLMVAVSLLFVAQAVVLFVFPEIFSGIIDWGYTFPVGAGILITIGVGEYLLAGAEKRMAKMSTENQAD